VLGTKVILRSSLDWNTDKTWKWVFEPKDKDNKDKDIHKEDTVIAVIKQHT